MSWATLVALSIVTLFSGYAVFLKGHWNTSSFLVSYIGIPIFFSKLNTGVVSAVSGIAADFQIALWAGSFLFFRDRIVSLRDMDLSEIHLIEAERDAAPLEKKLPWYRVLF
jgi:amino acid transporter